MRNLHIGCGSNIIKGWVNIDLDHPAADIHQDVRNGLPFEDNSVGYIFSEHMIEHLTLLEAEGFLLECTRVLAPGGVIRVSTPSLDRLIDAYLSGDKNYCGDLWRPETLCRMMNEAFHSWGHKFLYNRSEIRQLFERVGLSCFEFKSYRESSYSELNDLEVRPFHDDLIVEATKIRGLTNT